MTGVKLLYVVLLTLISMAMSSCSGKVTTLEKFSNKPYFIDNLEMVPIHNENVIDAYQDYLSSVNDDQVQVIAKKRLADLQLESGIDENYSYDSKINTESVKKIEAAIDGYSNYLKTYPDMSGNDVVRYQLARAYSIIGEHDKMLSVLLVLINKHPNSNYINESLFRLGEVNFIKKDFSAALKWYQQIIETGSSSRYFERALYKSSWCQYKLKNNDFAIKTSIKLINIKVNQGKLTETGIEDNLPLSEQRFIDDLVYITVLSLSDATAVNKINKYFSGSVYRKYEAFLYQELAKYYYSKDRKLDAAKVYLEFVKNNPLNYSALKFHESALSIYKKNGQTSLILENLTDYISRFGVNSLFWKKITVTQRKLITPTLKLHIVDLAKHYHSLARKNSIKSDTEVALKWYRVFLTWFPKDENAVRYHFLLAELLYDAKQFAVAASEYQKVAYEYPSHVRSEESAYAAVLAYNKLKTLTSTKSWLRYQDAAINNALKFINTFSEHRYISQLTIRTTEDLFKLNDYQRAQSLAIRLLDRKDIQNSEYRKSARLILAHSQFELKLYEKAELSYLIALEQLTDASNRSVITTRLAESIYKQAELLRDQGLSRQAAFQFMQVANVVPNARIRFQSDYDAAAMFILVQDWNRAAVLLEEYRGIYFGNKTNSIQDKLRKAFTEKIALVYSKTGQGKKAATELLYLAKTGDSEYRKTMLWRAAQMYQLANLDVQAIKIYKQYIKKYPYPLEISMDARKKIVDYYSKNNKKLKYQYWLRQIIKSDKLGGKHRTLHTNYLAAKATLALAYPKLAKYKRISLSLPIKTSLKTKKKLMKQTLQAYERAMDYKISDIYTQATYEIAEIYHDFSQAIMKSQRPAKLNEEQLEEYNLLLEEQAFPFEEKAITIHRANISRTRSGVYDDGIKNSFKALEVLFPVRYIKREKVSSYVTAIL